MINIHDIARRKMTYILLVLFAFVFELFVFSVKEPRQAAKLDGDYQLSDFELNHNVDFCGEKVPLYSQDVLERYDREIIKNANWHSEMTLLYKRTGKYFPMIERILKEEGIPDDFKYLCVIESGLDNVVSPAGASGFWQIMERTGREYGLTVNKQVDERYHLEKATRAACKYFRTSFKKFNSWTLVAASYNLGISGIERRLKKQQTDSYYDLLLNTETSRYVFRILAVKEILTKPEKYKFRFDKKIKYPMPELKQIEVDSSIKDIAEWSKSQGYNYKIVKLFNPWLRRKYLNNPDSTPYKIALPTGDYYIFASDTSGIEEPDTLTTVEEIKNAE